MKISDLIANFIVESLNKSEDLVEIQRNELASKFSCAPSQINYVIETRFKCSNGYIVESRRGGGGCIKIRRIDMEKNLYIAHLIDAIGENISYHESILLTESLIEKEFITSREGNFIISAVHDKFLSDMPSKNFTRAELLKSLLMLIAN